MKNKPFARETVGAKLVETNPGYFPLVNAEAQNQKPKQEEMFMSTATCTNQFETVQSSNQFAPNTGLASENGIGHSRDFQFPKAEGILPRKTLRELMGCIGKNPKLVDELVCQATRDARIAVLKKHNIIDSETDLPTKEEANRAMKQLLLPSERAGEMISGRNAFIAIIACGGNFEDWCA